MNAADERLEAQVFGEEAMDVYNRIGKGDPRNDSYGEMADVVPVTIRNAGLLLREAKKKAEAAEEEYKAARQKMDAASSVWREAINEYARAEHRLKISAMQPNGGEA